MPGKRYALTLQLMLKRFERKRKAGSVSRSPKVAREPPHHRMGYPVDPQASNSQHHPQQHQPISPTYDAPYPHQGVAVTMPQGMHPGGAHQHYPQYQPSVDHILEGFAHSSNEQLPVWLSDQTLGGASFSQNGIDAFLLPPDYLPTTTQIW